MKLREVIILLMLIASGGRGFSADAGGDRANVVQLPALEELRVWFEPLRYGRATLAPDGRLVAYTETGPTDASSSTGEFHDIVILRNADTDEIIGRVDGGERVSYLQWAGSDRVLFQSNRTDINYRHPGLSARKAALFDEEAIGTLGRRSTEVHLYDAIGKTDRLLGDTFDFGLGMDRPRRPMVHHLSIDADQAIVSAKTGRTIGVFSVDLRTGRRTKIEDRDFPSGQVLLDKSGMPRIALSSEVPRSALYSENKGKSWRPLRAGAQGAGAFKIDENNYFGKREMPLAFEYDRDVIYYGSNLGRNTVALYGLNIKTGQPTGFRLEDPDVDLVDLATPFASDGLVWDRFNRRLAGVRVAGLKRRTLWVDPELEKLQKIIEANLPNRDVEIVDWDRRRERFLILTSDDSDPGRYYIFDRKLEKYRQIVKRAPAIDTESTGRRRSFYFTRRDGGGLSGYITQPNRPDSLASPVVFLLHDAPWERAQAGYEGQAQALAAMGFVVVQLNYAGTTGFGAKLVEDIYGEFDRRPVADIMETLDWMTKPAGGKAPKVALIGKGFGGYVALRALQMHPAVFSCAIAVDPIIDLKEEQSYHLRESALRGTDSAASLGNVTARLRSAAYAGFLGRSSAPLAQISVLQHAKETVNPIMLVQNPKRRISTGRSENQLENRSPAEDPSVEKIRSFRDVVVKNGGNVVYVEMDDRFEAGVPAIRADLFLQFGSFIRSSLWDFKVEIGTIKALDEQ